MTTEAITVRIEPAQKAALDALARRSGSDLDRVVAEAIANHLALHRWQEAHIAEGLRQSEAGEFASEEEVEAAYARWR